MSLIDEALKRARMEAAQKAADSEGLPYPTIPRHLNPRRRRAWLAPAVVAAAVAAGLLIGWTMASRGPRGEDAAARGGNTSPAAPLTSGPATPDEVTRDPLPAEAARDPLAAEPESPAPTEARPNAPGQPPAAPVAPSASDGRATAEPPSRVAAPTTRPVETVPAESRSAESPSDERPAGDPPVERTEGTPAEAPSTTTVTDPDSGMLLVLPDRPREAAPEMAAEPTAESYVQSYPLPGGGSIELGGIAWSETGPFALLNGRVVGPGAVVQEYTLERIRPGHVELAGDGRRIHLSLQ